MYVLLGIKLLIYCVSFTVKFVEIKKYLLNTILLVLASPKKISFVCAKCKRGVKEFYFEKM
jgi:hypothetical protein